MTDRDEQLARESLKDIYDGISDKEWVNVPLAEIVTLMRQARREGREEANDDWMRCLGVTSEECAGGKIGFVVPDIPAAVAIAKARREGHTEGWKRGLMGGQLAMRERAAKVADSRDTSDMEVWRTRGHIAYSIRTLEPETPEEPK